MCERLKQAVLKTAVPERVPGVRIPLPPPFLIGIKRSGLDDSASNREPGQDYSGGRKIVGGSEAARFVAAQDAKRFRTYLPAADSESCDEWPDIRFSTHDKTAPGSVDSPTILLPSSDTTNVMFRGAFSTATSREASGYLCGLRELRTAGCAICYWVDCSASATLW